MTSPAAPPPPPRDLEEAAARLADVFRTLPRGAVVALSGGTDSALVLDAAVEAFSPARVVAATSRSESLAPEELEAARERARAAGVEHVVLAGSELSIEAFRRNAPDRCFHCKDHLFDQLSRLARDRGVPQVLDGTNADDTGDHRPGMRALRELKVLSPLLDLGFTKAEIRSRARRLGIAHHDLPESACLASRVLEGTPVTRGKLAQIEQGEAYLKSLGFKQVRLRHHGDLARIEVGEAELPRLMEKRLRSRLTVRMRRLGFRFVAADLEGYKRGGGNLRIRQD